MTERSSVGALEKSSPILALALDLDDFDEARALARVLKPYFPVVKVGLELFFATGTEAVARLCEDGFDVFLDVKLHDIPTTVERASSVLGRVGARYLTLHTAGGKAMLRAGVDGLAAGAEKAGLAPPMALGVTVLTSASNPPPDLIKARAAIAKSGGCGGLVCAAPDLGLVRSVVPDLLFVVPGTRPAGAALDDQARVATPEQAALDGAGMLVIGRAVTRASDPVLAARQLAQSLAVATP